MGNGVPHIVVVVFQVYFPSNWCWNIVCRLQGSLDNVRLCSPWGNEFWWRTYRLLSKHPKLVQVVTDFCFLVCCLPNSNPVFTSLLAWIFLKEKCTILDCVFTVFTLTGVILIARPPFLFGEHLGGIEGNYSNHIKGTVAAFAGDVIINSFDHQQCVLGAYTGQVEITLATRKSEAVHQVFQEDHLINHFPLSRSLLLPVRGYQRGLIELIGWNFWLYFFIWCSKSSFSIDR